MRLIVIISVVLLHISSIVAAVPGWVKAKPSSMIYYTGVGMAAKTNKDYMNTAKKIALNDLISEIRVDISSNSILERFEDNKGYKEKFSQNIQSSAADDIEQFELVETWSDDSEYWVYYQLDKKVYEEYKKKRKDEAVRKAYDIWCRGTGMLTSGNLQGAFDLYCKGLKEIQPVANEELLCKHNGDVINIGNELYNSVLSIFDNVSVKADPSSLSATCFHGIDTPVSLNVSRNATPLGGVVLKASFTSGGGELSSIPPTTSAGTTTVKINNVTSRLSRQEVKIGFDAAMLNQLKNTQFTPLYESLSAKVPYTQVDITAQTEPLKAFIMTGNDTNNSLTEAIKSYLSQNYFNIVEYPQDADVGITINSEFREGLKIKGELYDMVEVYSSANIKILSYGNNAELLNYSTDNIRSLAPYLSSKPKAKAIATREVMKKLTRSLPAKFNSINIEKIEPLETDSAMDMDEDLF